jgi:hypothetical protein
MGAAGLALSWVAEAVGEVEAAERLAVEAAVRV